MKNWKNLSFETKAKLFDRLFSSIIDEIPLGELPNIQNQTDVEDLREEIKEIDEAKQKDDLKEESLTKLNKKKLIMKFIL